MPHSPNFVRRASESIIITVTFSNCDRTRNNASRFRTAGCTAAGHRQRHRAVRRCRPRPRRADPALPRRRRGGPRLDPGLGRAAGHVRAGGRLVRRARRAVPRRRGRGHVRPPGDGPAGRGGRGLVVLRGGADRGRLGRLDRREVRRRRGRVGRRRRRGRGRRGAGRGAGLQRRGAADVGPGAAAARCAAGGRAAVRRTGRRPARVHRALHPVHARRLVLGRLGGLRALLRVRGLGGGEPSVGGVRRPPAGSAAGDPLHPRRDHRALPGPRPRHDRRAGTGRGPHRHPADRTAHPERGRGRPAGRRGGRAVPDLRRGQLLSGGRLPARRGPRPGRRGAPLAGQGRRTGRGAAPVARRTGRGVRAARRWRPVPAAPIWIC